MTRQRIRLAKIGSIALAAYLTMVPASASQGGQVAISAGAESMLQRCLGSEAAPAASGGGRQLFEAVLASSVFRHGRVGPFDVHVLVGKRGSAVKDADKVRDAVLLALTPASDLIDRLWPAGGEGLISASRFPVVIATDRTDYLQLVALLDHCERAGYSGWAPGKMIDSSEARGAEFVHTWDVQVFDLTHPVIAERRDAWLKHGVGHYSLGFVATRALQRGAWGVVPPWLLAGLTDELDIAAYGEAWVCEGGWAGFHPNGKPSMPQAGASADLEVARKSGKTWLARDASRTRHWRQLVADTKSRTSASFVPAADTDGCLPRDRAAARCLMHLLLQGSGGGPVLTSLLDRPVQTPADGMLDSDPLPVIFARALGGIPEVDRLEALDTRTLLTELGRQDLIERLEQSRAADALALSDHRAQSAWLYDQPYDGATRKGLFQVFLEIEHLQQMAEWKALGPHLDSGLRSALKACNDFPTQDRSVAAVTQAFRVGLAKRGDETEAGAPSTKARSPSKVK